MTPIEEPLSACSPDRRDGVAIPGFASSFVARTDELAAITGSLARDRLVSLVGPGGSGKTRLAAEAVRTTNLLGFVELASMESGSPLPPTVLAACGIREDPDRSPGERLLDRLRDREGVLVLDNCERVRGAVAELVAALLRACPGLRVLATSRVVLGVLGESVRPIGSLADGGVGLFLERARGVQPGLAQDPDTIASARAICSLTDGLPLVVELAAAHAQAMPLAEIEAGMADRLRFAATDDPGLTPRHRSLQACLAWSVEGIDPRTRRALGALSVLGGRFGLEAATAVTGGDRTVIETLVAHSLLQFDAGDGRYLLLDTVRDHAAEMLSATQDAEPVHARLAGWVAGLSHAVAEGLACADAAALARVDRDEAAIHAVLEHAARTGAGLDLAARIVVDLAFAWSLRGRCAQGRDWARRLGALLDDVPPRLAWATAFLTAYAGDTTAGFGLAVDAAERAARAGDHGTEGRALTLVGMIQMFVDPGGADPVLAGAVELAVTAGDDWGEVEARQMLAYAHLIRSDATTAVACTNRALPALERLDHAQLRAWDAAIRADAAVAQGRFVDAEAFGRTGLALAMDVEEPVSAGGALLPLVRALAQRGRAKEAGALVEDVRPFFDTHPGVGTALVVDLAAAIAAGWADPVAAGDAVVSVHETATAAGLPAIAEEAGMLRALAALTRGDADAAARLAGEAAVGAAGIGRREIACAAALVRCAADRSSPETPARAHDALAEAAAQGWRALVPEALDLVACVALDADRATVAARLHAAADRLRDELGAAISPLGRLLGADRAAVAGLLTDAESEAAHTEGARLDLDRAVAYAARSRGRRARPRSGWESLTPAEREVVALVGKGLGNRAVGEALLVTEGTVRTHLRSVFAKLGVASRAELAAQAARRDA